jgi:hypothetical protein
VDVLKRFFALVFVGIIAFSLAVIVFAHPGKTDGDGGHYNHDTGEYHYHHGYSAHQHPNGVCPYVSENTTDDAVNWFALSSIYIEIDNLEDVIRSEFGDEYGEEIRDAIVYSPDTELIEIYLTYYVEYDSLRNISMRQYGEDITDRIFSHPDLMVLTSEDVMNKHHIKKEKYENQEDNTTEYTEENEYDYTEEKPTLMQKIDDAMVKNIGISIIIIFLPGILSCLIGYLKGRFFNKKK